MPEMTPQTVARTMTQGAPDPVHDVTILVHHKNRTKTLPLVVKNGSKEMMI